MNGVEINTRAYVATRLLLHWDYLYAVTLKTKVFGDYSHARLEVSWITSTRDYFYAVTPALERINGFTLGFGRDCVFGNIILFDMQHKGRWKRTVRN